MEQRIERAKVVVQAGRLRVAALRAQLKLGEGCSEESKARG